MRKFSLFSVVLLVIFLFGVGILGYLKNTEQKNSQEVAGESSQSIAVSSVIDGDTLKLSDGITIRLIGINTPEKGQPYFELAKSKLEALTAAGDLDIQFDLEKLDRYGRTLAYLYSAEKFINLELVKSGVAVVETIPPNVIHAEEFSRAQQESRNNCRGIWEGLCSDDTSVCVQISGINRGESSPSLNSEWIEFINTCSASQDMGGYLIKDSSASNSYTFNNFRLGPKERVKLYSGCSKNLQNSLYWQCPERSSAVWNNDSDHAYLYNSKGKLISEAGY
jgi:micrococcal nuclease